MSRSADFWSRRKAAVAADDVARSAADEATAREEVAEAKSDEEILAELELPDPDTLGEGDDFTRFLSKTVPQRIRNRALRRLWLTNPVLANLDGLVEYGEDYTDAATVIENLTTAYQVGKGMTRHVVEMARQAAAEAEGEPEQEASEPDPAQPEDEPEVTEAAVEAVDEPVPDSNGVPDSGPSDKEMRVRARRMRYHFDSSAKGTG